MALIYYEYVLYGNNQIAINSASYIDRPGSTVFYYESANYVSPTIYLEVGLKNVNNSVNKSTVKLQEFASGDIANTAGSDVTSGAVTASTTTMAVYRTAALTLTDGYRYKIQNIQQSASTTVVLSYAKIVIIDDVGTSTPSAVSPYIPLQLTHNTAVTSTSASYVESSSAGRFTYTASQWGGTKNIYFEANIATNNASGISYAELYDITDGAAVGSSEVTSTSNSTTYGTRVGSGAITLTDGHEYAVYIKTNNASYTTSIWASYLIIKQTGTITATRLYAGMGGFRTRTGATTYLGTSYNVYKYNTADWTSSTPVIKANYTAMTSNATATSYGGITTINSTTLLTNSEVGTTSTTKAIVASAALTLSNGTSYQGNRRISNSTYTATAHLQVLTFDLTWAVAVPFSFCVIIG